MVFFKWICLSTAQSTDRFGSPLMAESFQACFKQSLKYEWAYFFSDSICFVWRLRNRLDNRKFELSNSQIKCGCNEIFQDIFEVSSLSWKTLKSFYQLTKLRDAPRVKNPGGQVVMRRAAAAWRLLLICQNLGGQLPPLPPPLVHPCSIVANYP